MGRDAQTRLALQTRAQAPGLQCLGVALFDERAAGMSQQRFALSAGAGQVLVQPRCHHAGVVFGNVVQVVGHAAAHIGTGVVLQALQQRQAGARVGHQRLQPHAPGQARARAFTGQAAHMHIAVLRPFRQRGAGQGRVFCNERAQRKFGAEALRDGVQAWQSALGCAHATAHHPLAHAPQNPARQTGLCDAHGAQIFSLEGRRQGGFDNACSLRKVNR